MVSEAVICKSPTRNYWLPLYFCKPSNYLVNNRAAACFGVVCIVEGKNRKS